MLEQHDQMQREMEEQRQEIAHLREENLEGRKIKEELLPNLLDSGLVAENPENQRLQAAESFEQQQAFKEWNSKRKRQRVSSVNDHAGLAAADNQDALIVMGLDDDVQPPDVIQPRVS